MMGACRRSLRTPLIRTFLPGQLSRLPSENHSQLRSLRGRLGEKSQLASALRPPRQLSLVLVGWWPMATRKNLIAPNDFELFQKAILRLEAKRKSRIFCFIEGPSDRLCPIHTFPRIFTLRKQFQNIKTLEILIHSGGGDARTAYSIAKFFRQHCKTLNVIVPFQAKSAATLMCLAADNIYLSEFGELGPLDVQVTDPLERGASQFSPLDEFKSLEFLREYAVESLDYFTGLLLEQSGMSIKEALHESIPCITAMIKPLYEKIDPLQFGEHRRMLSEGEEYAKRLLKLAKHPNSAKVAAKLVEKYPAHDFVIDFHEALDELELPVRKLDRVDFEAIQPMVSLTNEGFYGFVKQKKQVTRRKHGAKKGLTVIPRAATRATA